MFKLIRTTLLGRGADASSDFSGYRSIPRAYLGSKDPRKVIVSFIIKCVNHSRLQNEENISVSAMISHGSFPESKFRNSVVTNGGRTVVVSKAGGILHYGTFQSLPFDVNIPVNEELFLVT